MFEPFTQSLTVFACVVLTIAQGFASLPKAEASIDTGKSGRVVRVQASSP